MLHLPVEATRVRHGRDARPRVGALQRLYVDEGGLVARVRGEELGGFGECVQNESRVVGFARPCAGFVWFLFKVPRAPK